MANFSSTPATKYNMNSIADIHTHSASLFNERMAWLMADLDMKAISMNTTHNLNAILETKAILKQIYKNVRCLISNNPVMRSTMNLDTKDPGIYITDVAMALIDNMVEYCNDNGYSIQKIKIIVFEINNFEVLLKNIMQYYHYFMRPNFQQKPDVDTAVEKYKAMADERTIGELREIVGKKHLIDFESLGQYKREREEIEDSVNPTNRLEHDDNGLEIEEDEKF